MNCKDFRDIADSYLSNELLVETNHDVLRHLELCRDCRELLAARREIRERLRTTIKSTDEFAIDPKFAMKLKAMLRNEAVKPRFAMSGLHFAAAGVATVVLVLVCIFFVIRINDGDRPITKVNPPPTSPANTILPDAVIGAIPAVLIEAAWDAIDDHKNCALKHNLAEKPISLEEAAKKIDVVNAGFDKIVIAAVKEELGDEARLIKAHYCLINGKSFTHVVFETRKRTVSVLMTKLQGVEALNNEPLACGESDGLRSACFASNGYGLFVVSDNGENENLAIARVILNPVREHLNKGRITI